MTDKKKAARIKEICLNTHTKDPIALAIAMMKDEIISMHGPEHHILDGAALLTAVYHSGVDFDLSAALDEMIARGDQMPGAICGRWGVCGSAASVGAAMAIIYHTGPLSSDEAYQSNMELTSKALLRIAEIGGPRCCKRNAFLSLSTAVKHLQSQHIELESHPVHCEFSDRNPQCLHEKCPFHTK